MVRWFRAMLNCSLLGEVFDRLAPKLIIYSDCLAGFSEAMRAISQKEKKNVNFQKCLHEIQVAEC